MSLVNYLTDLSAYNLDGKQFETPSDKNMSNKNSFLSFQVENFREQSKQY